MKLSVRGGHCGVGHPTKRPFTRTLTAMWKRRYLRLQIQWGRTQIFSGHEMPEFFVCWRCIK